ncbi:hypothetical protein F4778DRAFT_734380 [Xylariomycetidae sp. FL2044]|nr:hypothetical protein F4778DRAFT_734380 [Xylariomycetidae sp. FL2044]
MRKRRRLLRAAMAFKATLLTYRECLFDIELVGVQAQRGGGGSVGVLQLRQKLRSPSSRIQYRPFPKGLTSGVVEHEEAALANNQCTAALALLGRLAKKLLSGTASSIQNMDLRIGKPALRTQLVPGPNTSECPHSVLKATLSSSSSSRRGDEAWVLDPAGCQYGFGAVLTPYDQYMAVTGASLVSPPEPYQWTETKDLDFFDSLPGMNLTGAQRADCELERELRLHFAAFVDGYFAAAGVGRLGGGAKGFLEGCSAAEFEGRRLGGFREDLRKHLMSYIEQNGLYKRSA